MEHQLEWYDGRRLGLADLRTIAWHETPRRVVIPRHRPAGTKLALVVAGSVDLLAEPPRGRPRRIALVGGRFALLPQEWHFSGAADGRFLWASIAAAPEAAASGGLHLLSPEQHAALAAALPRQAGRPLVADPELLAAAPALAEAMRRSAGRLRLAAHAALLLDGVLEALAHPRRPDAGDAAIDALVARLDADPAADPGADGLATAAGLSRALFFRRFRQRTGETPHRYLLRLRCRRVAEAVSAGATVDAAWRRAGFASRQAWRRAVVATGPDLATGGNVAQTD